jgi:molybdate transport system substrate-binding protein
VRPQARADAAAQLLGWVAVLSLAGVQGGCSAGTGKDTLLVFAASSLTEAFGELERTFEQDHPEVDVVLNLAGSQTLRVQIEQGATADVFASANAAHMDALASAGHVREHRAFAASELVLVVPTSNPAQVHSFHDLPRAKRIVVGAPEVPVGSYTRTILEQAGERIGADFRARVEQHIVSREANVRLVLAKVELGEADAAVVYRTDAAAWRRVKIVDIPGDLAQRADYHIGLTARAQRPELARAWLELVLSPTGQDVLAGHGFAVEPR